jgi:hypothetical protein
MTTSESAESFRDHSRSGSPVAAADAQAPESLIARATRAPATWIALFVGLSTVIRAANALGVPSPWILPDEVVYSELAKSIAGGGLPSIRGVPELGWGVVYPIVIAPAWLLFGDLVSAYHAALVLNSLIMSLAAVPAYLLARVFVARRPSYLVALMTVLVPSMTYTGVVMTENACYPAFVLALLLIARCVRRPTMGSQALTLLALGIVALTRIQGVALVAAYVGAVAVYALTGDPKARVSYLRRFLPTGAVLLLMSLAAMLVSVARGHGIVGWLGSHSSAFDGFHVREVPEWFAYLAAGLLLYVAVVPALATVVMVARGLSTRASEPVRLFSALVLPTVAAMLGSVSLVSASLDVDGHENLNERYVFYVVPLLFIGLALWIGEKLPRPRYWAAAVVAACCALTMSLPIDRLRYNAEFQSLALLPWLKLSLGPVALAATLGAFAVLAGVLWITCRRDRVGRLWLVVGVWMSFLGLVAVGQAREPAQYYAHAHDGRTASWVDAAAANGTKVPVVWDQRAVRDSPDFFYYWLVVTEFFNASVGDVYRIGGPTYYETFLPTIPVDVAKDGTITARDGSHLTPRFVLTTCRTRLRGETMAEASKGALRLVEVRGPLRLAAKPGCRRAKP